MENLRKFSRSYTKILRKYFIEKLYKIDDKKRQNCGGNWKKFLQKFCESFAEILYEFWEVFMEIMRNLVIMKRKVCGSFTESLKNTCEN